jgi:hypothetical protein
MYGEGLRGLLIMSVQLILWPEGLRLYLLVGIHAAPPPPVKTLIATIVNFNGTGKTLSVFSDGSTTLK